MEYPARQFALWNDQLVKIFFTKSVEILQCFKYILDLDLIKQQIICNFLTQNTLIARLYIATDMDAYCFVFSVLVST